MCWTSLTNICIQTIPRIGGQRLLFRLRSMEKYRVFAAMHTCTTRSRILRIRFYIFSFQVFRQLLYPRQIFIQALRYGLESLVNEAVSHLVDELPYLDNFDSEILLPDNLTFPTPLQKCRTFSTGVYKRVMQIELNNLGLRPSRTFPDNSSITETDWRHGSYSFLRGPLSKKS